MATFWKKADIYYWFQNVECIEYSGTFIYNDFLQDHFNFHAYSVKYFTYPDSYLCKEWPGVLTELPCSTPHCNEKSHLCIPFLGIARPKPQFPHFMFL